MREHPEQFGCRYAALGSTQARHAPKTGSCYAMKSAYDLAMERLEKQSPSVKLTEEQRSQLAEIDSLYKSRIAEKELLLNDLIRRERAAGKASEVESLQKQLASEIRRLSEECESKKEQIRQAAG
jgi:chromosome condensin MukBEF ATPase and DNA-binding subunit MukB